jgi:hypothetical protein
MARLPPILRRLLLRLRLLESLGLLRPTVGGDPLRSMRLRLRLPPLLLLCLPQHLLHLLHLLMLRLLLPLEAALHVGHGVDLRQLSCQPWRTTHQLLKVQRGGARVRSHRRFRNRGTEYVSEAGVKWMSSRAKRQCRQPQVAPTCGSASSGPSDPAPGFVHIV